MAGLLLIILLAVSAGLVFWGLLRPDRLYQYPFLAGVVFAGWVVPQLVGLLNDVFLPAGALEKTLAMCILSVSACFIGYVWHSPRHFPLNLDYNEDRLLAGGIVLTLVGGYFYAALSALPEEMTSSTQFSGAPVAYLFFAHVLIYGFAICTFLYLRNGSWLALLAAAFGSLFFLNRIVFLGRRGDMLELAFIVLLAFWFTRGRIVPRAVMMLGVVVSVLLFHSIGEYRAIMKKPDENRFEDVLNIDVADNLSALLSRGGLELTNAVYNISAIEKSSTFDLGLFHWNQLVFNYVPAQLFGPGIKEALTIPLDNDVAEEAFGYEAAVGTTSTGMTDAFGSFWYFGALKFALIAYAMAIIYRSAMTGNVTAQLAYMLILPGSLHSITHHTQWFVSPWVHMVVFLLPVLLLARARKTTELAAQRPWLGSPRALGRAR